VRVLVDHGADVNARDKTNGQTALMFAAAVNSAEAIKILLARGADANLTTNVVRLERVQVDANGNPLPAPPEGQRGGGQRGGGGDRILGATVVGGLSALHFATREGQLDAVRELVSGNANVNITAG